METTGTTGVIFGLYVGLGLGCLGCFSQPKCAYMVLGA